MKLFRLAAALAVLILGCGVATAQGVDCRSSVVYDASTNGSTKLVTGASTKTVYVCGFTLMAGGTVNVSLVYGTGTNCATGETAATPAFQMVAQTNITDSSVFWRGLSAPIGKDLCIKTSAGVAVQAILYYVQR